MKNLQDFLNETVDTKKRSKIVVALEKNGLMRDKDFFYDGGFMAKDRVTADEITDVLAGEYRVTIHDDKQTRDGKILLSIG